MQEVARAIGCDPSTVTALVKKLVAAGYVRTNKGTEDRRATIVSLTGRGRGLRDEFACISASLREVQSRGIGDAELETTRRVLAAMRENFEHAMRSGDGEIG